VIIDRTAWGRVRVSGGDRVRFLQGITTVNVSALADGAHGWGSILTPKGRVVAVIDVARDGETFIVSCEGAIAEKTRAALERYAVMDDVAFDPIVGALHQIWDTAADAWAAPLVAGAPTRAGDVVPETAPEAEALRIHAGFLRYGADVDEDHFPFETPLGGFLDYGKGCYVGQEPVFRVHAQGGAARQLRGLVIGGGTAPIAAGTPIAHPSKAAAGVVTSSVAEGDGVIALGYLHRTCWDAGGTVEIAGRAATVYELPW
jgi:folate-binding protein YgfZ